MTQENFLKYPIGQFQWHTDLSEGKRNDAKERLENFPKQLIDLMHTIPDSLLTKRYRTGSWNAIQVVHHLADSHMHSFLRCKHALLENEPHIKDYQEKAWAPTPDANDTNISLSMNLLTALHERWIVFFESLSENEFKKSYYQPERNKKNSLDTELSLNAWHGEHHLAHLKNIIKNPFD